MKRTLLIFLSLFLCSALSAQERSYRSRILEDDDYISYRRNELSIEYGAPSVMQMTTFLNRRPARNNGQSFGHENPWFSGIAGVNYNYYVRRTLKVGGYFGIDGAGMDYLDESGQKVFRNRVLSMTVMASLHWLYYRGGLTELSGGVFAGVSVAKEKILDFDRSISPTFEPTASTRTIFAYHLSVIKARFGGDIGGYVELGFGYKGIVNAGLSIKM